MIRTYSCRGPDAGSAVELDGAAVPSGAVWVDVLEPSPEEVAFLERAGGVSTPSREQLSEVESSSRLRREGDDLYLSLPIAIRAGGESTRITPFGLILTRERLVTIRYDELKSVDAFRERLRAGHGVPSTLGVLVLLLEAIVDRLADVLEEVGRDLDSVSETIFAVGSPAAGRRAKKTSDQRLRAAVRQAGRDRQLISKVRATLQAIGRIAPYVRQETRDWMPEEAGPRFETLEADIASLDEFEEHLADKVQFVLDAALGLISIEQNDTFRVLTVVSVVGIPPTLVASLYGMNFKHMPELDWVYGYPYGLALIAASAVAPLLYFRYRGWF